jgi:hypothetical protein
MKVKEIVAQEGWGTSSIEKEINNWLDKNENIEVIDIGYTSYTQEKRDYYGHIKLCLTEKAIIMYKDK